MKNPLMEDELRKESNFLDEVKTVLSSVSSNLQGLFSDLDFVSGIACLDTELEQLQKETQQLYTNIEFLICNQLQGTRREMTELHKELVLLRSKYKNLQNEWDKQQEHLGKMQMELFKARNQLQHQTQYCASLGAITGNLIWKASRIPQIVDMLLAGNKVAEFLSI
ncbi:hypothetical protein L9F63_015751 [Diploptera punctata]|uniref:Uncharacterized protein n=1 Tax=Diploptera punctata TaxID=6984 RepID=A0AAD8A5W0_DIPPU|nr:hypothetical protein L9F63_015751 [Diploptera punctata]